MRGINIGRYAEFWSSLDVKESVAGMGREITVSRTSKRDWKAKLGKRMKNARLKMDEGKEKRVR
jgi:hypothetical protein